MEVEEVLLKNCSTKNLSSPYNRYAELIGINNLYLLAKELGGTSIYIPKTQFLLREVIENQLIDEFNGSNYKKLAQKYKVCERTIRNRLRGKI